MKGAAIFSICVVSTHAGTNQQYQYGGQPQQQAYGQQQRGAQQQDPYGNRAYNYDARDPYYNEAQGGVGESAKAKQDPYQQYNNQQYNQAAQQQQQQQQYNQAAQQQQQQQQQKYNDPYANVYDDYEDFDNWNHEPAATVGGGHDEAFTAQVEDEFKQDFGDFDLNRDNVVDPLEVRSHFQNEVSADELAQFWYDVDVDNSGTITWPEYRQYAKDQYGQMDEI